MTNMAIWDMVEMTDPEATKTFNRGGGFKGTAINATYLTKKATEVFGPMGIRWGVDIVDESLMEGAILDEIGNREIIHKVRIKLWYYAPDDKECAHRGEVTHFGQTAFVGRNKYGLFTDEEAPKKSLTDAMTKALSMLGFSADVHLGLFDDNKYVNMAGERFRQIKEEDQKKRQKDLPKINSDEESRLKKALDRTDTNVEKFCEFFKVDSLSDLPRQSFDRAVSILEKKLASRIAETA